MEEELVTPKCRVAAVVPASGIGQRMGGDLPKQYLQVGGRPLIAHCLRALEEVPWVERTVLVADDFQRMNNIIQEEALSKVIVTTRTGKGSRHLSIKAGVEALVKYAPDVVIVHDGVRPLMPLEILTKVVMAAEKYGAAGAVRPLISTVVKPDEEGLLQESLVRSQYLNSEMPQAFRFSVLLQAYQRCSDHDLHFGTECLALAFNYCDIKAKLVTGPPELWKVTLERDLHIARLMVPKYTRRTAILCQALRPSLSPLQGSTPVDHQRPRAVNNVSNECLQGGSGVIGAHESKQCQSTGNAITGEQGSDKDNEIGIFDKCPAIPGLRCDSECCTVYKYLEKTLRNNSLSVTNCSLRHSIRNVCTLIIISNLPDLISFKTYLELLLEKVERGLFTVILILTLKFSAGDLTLKDLNGMRQDIKKLSRKISAKITVVIRTIDAHEDRAAYDSVSLSQEDQDTMGSSNLADMIKAILDQPTECFNGQIIIMEKQD